jgi:uncharacterized protein YukE
MLTDTNGIRDLARRMRERAEEVRAEAALVRRRTDDVPWQGRAADAMRTQVAARLATLTATAALHDDAAEALDRHAGAVDAVAGLVEGAVHQLERLL